jgi:stage V sporulation protein D (sporulation-specific penicillin-binding protein)
MRNRNNKSMDRRSIEIQRKKRAGKLKFIIFCFILCFVGLTVRIFYIKAEFGNAYEREAIIQQVTKNAVDRTIMPNRGDILDRNENTQALAVSTTVYNVIFDVKVFLERRDSLDEDKQAEYQNNAFSAINEILEIPIETLEGYLTSNAESNYLRIKKNVSGKKKEELEQRVSGYIWFEEDTLRRYPGKNLASALIGFTRGDNSNWGIEAQYNDELSGKAGRMVRLYDKDNNAVTEKIDPVKGYTVVTTIDLMIQQEAQRLVEKYGKEAESENAAILVMAPNTGEIIAMAQYPSYDLNDPFDIASINKEDLRANLELLEGEKRTEALYSIWKNFNISYTFEPGSIYKPLVVAAALEEGVITPNDSFYCGGEKYILGVRIPCWSAGHGHQNVKEVLAHSCNVGVMDIVEKLGREKYYKYQKDYGVGEKTGIDLPGEGGTGTSLYYTLSQLNPVELGVCAMGQGFNMTAIQMITAFSSVINGGNLMKPYVVSRVVDENKNIVSENEPTVQRRIISEETSSWMREALTSVVEEGGTGKKAAIEGYKIGGKTGTAQQGIKVGDGSEALTLTFMEYFPADNPQYIILSIIDRSTNYDGANAKTIPMARDLTSFIIQYKKIPPSEEAEKSESGLYEDTLMIEDYTGKSISETINSLNYLGLTYEVTGSGSKVKNQIPASGTRVAKGSKVFITIEEEGDGQDIVLVPNVVGMTKDQAQEIVVKAGLVPVIIENKVNSAKNEAPLGSSTQETETPPEDSSEVQEEKVVSQLISEIKIQKGTEIVIYTEKSN